MYISTDKSTAVPIFQTNVIFLARRQINATEGKQACTSMVRHSIRIFEGENYPVDWKSSISEKMNGYRIESFESCKACSINLPTHDMLNDTTSIFSILVITITGPCYIRSIDWVYVLTIICSKTLSEHSFNCFCTT